MRSQPGIRQFWRALAAFAACVVLTWTVGALLQFRHLLIGLALTEVLFFALPAAVVLYLRRREEAADQRFSLPLDLPRSADFESAATTEALRLQTASPRSSPPGSQPLCAPFWPASRLPTIREAGLSISLGVLAVMAAVGAGLATRVALGAPPPSAGPPWLLGLALAFGTALCEQLLFRSVVQRGFGAVWSPAAAVLGTAVLFGLVHGSLIRFPEIFLLGLFGGVVNLKTGRYGACVLFQATTNLLGPLLWSLLPRWPALFHPLSSLAFAGAAVYVAWQFTRPGNTRVWGIVRHLRWALFGTTSATLPPARAPVMTFVVYWLGVVSMVVVIVGLGLAETAALRVAQAMANVRQQDVWTLDHENVITAYTRVYYERWPTRRESATFALPYTEAKVQQARIGGVDATVRSLGAGTFELVWPDRLPERPRLVEVLWSMPLTALDEPERGYRVRLQALVPVTAYALVLRLAPGAGYEFEAAPEKRETEIFSILQAGPVPKNHFGTCGVGIQRRDGSGRPEPLRR